MLPVCGMASPVTRIWYSRFRPGRKTVKKVLRLAFIGFVYYNNWSFME